jgi:type VI protein secretion system component VasK
VFRPNGGRISQFYEQSLRGKVLNSNGGQFRSAGSGLVPTEQLTQFLTRAKRITDALFPGGSSEPRVQFTLRPQLSDPSPITVTFGDESFNAVKGSEQPFTGSWRFGDSSYVGFARRGSNAAQDIGPWAPFKIYWEEARRAGPNGGRMYDIVLSGAIRGSIELTIAAGGLADPAFFSGLNCPTKAVQ